MSRHVLRTQSLSLAYAAKLALDGAGIPAVVQGESTSGALGIPFTVAILQDDDLERAMEVLREASGDDDANEAEGGFSEVT